MISPPPSRQSGFSLAELLIATAISLITAAVAADLLIAHLRSGERAEALERQRTDWARTSGFIEAEVALSERVIDQAANIAIPSSCGISATQFRLGLDLRRDLPPVIYGLLPSSNGWLSDNTLWRCGPGINNDGSYNNTLSKAPILDGLDNSSGGNGFLAAASSDRKQANFTLALKGHARVTYQQADSAQTRVNPLYSRPSENSLCDSANLVRLEGSSNTADTLVMSIGQVRVGEDILICGRGFGSGAAGAIGDNITGSTANDILEAGDYGKATLNGLSGNDVLRGTLEADSLFGGDGDDVLIGRSGNDKLDGGNGQNSYLPGAGDDSVTGGTGLDIVFFSGNRSSYTLSGGCSKKSCTVSGPEGTDTLSSAEILIFKDARVDLPD